MIDLTIDGVKISVPEGTLIVDAARRVDINIPVFCYHPKMEPAGMCRLCLVEIGRPVIDRATNQVQLDADGNPVIRFGPKLETACTTPVSQGMVVNTESKQVATARKDIIEFLLTSHPLDCPVCDKGGECPLQNLTMKYGSDHSNFLLADKQHLAKHFPLGDFIMLDRERCIQCGRCVRFQREIADDPVIGFYRRGRAMQIMTNSVPGFDSIFSGNTADICPVGALTTTDFRFGARPWEMNYSPSVCDQCPVGCNIIYNVRQEAKSGGRKVVKRVMPRQNEQVNEIWICDKGRIGYHYTEAKDRLQQPMLRVDDDFAPISWEEAYTILERKMVFYGADMLAIVGGSLANEDLYSFDQLARRQGGSKLLYSHMGGGDLVTKLGLSTGSNIGDLGKGDVILVASCDLHQEAPIWWLRVKEAAERGAQVITVNGRPTRLDKFAKQVIRFEYGKEAETLGGLLHGELREALQNAANLVVFYGSDGVSLAGSEEVARQCADILVSTGHYGKPNNGLVAAWDGTNTQGAWEMGYKPTDNPFDAIARSGIVFVVGVDIIRADSRLAEAIAQDGFTVVHDLYMTETAKLADLVLPVQAHTEREGTYVSGERRVQRFYPAVPPQGESKPDYEIIATLANRLGRDMSDNPAQILESIAQAHPIFRGINYRNLAERVAQDPLIGRTAMYYGGNAYDNTRGIGIQLPAGTPDGTPVTMPDHNGGVAALSDEGVKLIPVSKLFYRYNISLMSDLVASRKETSTMRLNPVTAGQLGLHAGEMAAATHGDGHEIVLKVVLDDTLAEGVALIPRGAGFTTDLPAMGEIKKYVFAQAEPQPVTE